MLHRPMLVALLGQPTDDDRMIESVQLDPDRRYPVLDPRRPGQSVRLRIRRNRIEALVPPWWRTQLTLDLDSMSVQFWSRLEDPDGPPLWVFVEAPILGLSRSGGPLPSPAEAMA